MRIISWNVNNRNKKIKKGIRYILSLRPDVICLQEVPQRMMLWLHTISGYTVSKCFDSKHHHKSTKHIYVCTLTKQKPIRVKRHIYDNGFSNSLLTKLYTSLLHVKEQHTVLVATLQIRGKPIQIANTRLSCAIGTHDRLQEFTILIQKTKHPEILTIYCGDFNIVDSKIVNRLTGWLRGFNHFDYLLDERGSFEKLYQQEQLVNIFRGRSTSLVNRPLLQLDHILVPYAFPIQSHSLTRKRFGSDHRMLIIDVDNKLHAQIINKPVISVVVPAYNEEKRIASCIKALEKQTFSLPYEIIVCDNASTDHTVHIAKQFKVKIVSEKRKGVAYASATGVTASTAPIICMTDADTIVPPQWIASYYQYFTNHPNAVAASGPFQYADESPWMYIINLFNTMMRGVVIRNTVGMNMGFRKKAYDTVGGFETRFQLQTDSYLGLKLQRIGTVGFIRMEPVVASARRFRKLIPTIWEGILRIVNFYSLKYFNRPLTKNFVDIR